MMNLQLPTYNKQTNKQITNDDVIFSLIQNPEYIRFYILFFI